MRWILGLSVIGLAALSLFAWRQIRQAKGIEATRDRLAVTTEIYKLIGEFIGGAAIITGLAITWVQLEDSRQQFYETLGGQNQQIGLSRQQITLARRADAAGRLNAAIDNLGSDDAMIRVGGVLTLEQIAAEFPTQYGPSARTLIVSLLRRRATATEFKKATARGEGWPSPDITAAFEAIDRLITPQERRNLDLRSLYLQAANLRKLRAASLNLSHVVLRSAHLQSALLASARFHNADLRGAHLQGADLSGAHLEGADLRDANAFNVTLVNAQLEGANLARARLSLANLKEANLRGGTLRWARMVGTRLDRADLSGADLRDADLLTQPQIDVAIGDKSTKLPPTLRRPPTWRTTTYVTNQLYEEENGNG